MATFDVFHEVYRRPDLGSRRFTELMAGSEIVEGFAPSITDLATEADLDDVSSLVASWRILANGSARSVVDGNRNAGWNARLMANDLVVRHRAPLRAFAIDHTLDHDNQALFDALQWG